MCLHTCRHDHSLHPFTMAAPVASPPTTYAFIPPPPLPEFYLPKTAGGNNGSVSSTSAEDVSQALVRTKTKAKVTTQSRPQSSDHNAGAVALPSQQPAAPGDATDETMIKITRTRATSAPFPTLPPPPPGYGDGGGDVPPLAVYHICRICIRPRSARYHREHPIPINGVPPPPGICRRCRVTKIEEEVITETKATKPREKKVVEVVTRGESNEIKLGLACIVPDEDYVPIQEVKERRGRRLLQELDRQQRSRGESEETSEQREIAYRHVRVRETEQTVGPAHAREGFRIPPMPPPQPRKPRTTVISTAQDAIDSVSVQSRDLVMTTAAAASAAMQAQPAPVPSSRSVRSLRVTETVKEDTPKASLPSASSSASSCLDIKASALSESRIRKIAREEVEKYRQAERKLEAHPDAYAHGRMIPVQRRIEHAADVAEPLPWRKESDRIEVRVEREKTYNRSPIPMPRQSEPSQHGHRTESEWKASVMEAEPSEKYTGSGWSAARSQRDTKREIVIERVVRGISKPSESGRASDSHHSRAQPATKAVQDDRSTTSGSRSATSDKTRWARTVEERKDGKVPRSDAPASVKPREEAGWNDASASYTTREIWLPPGSKYDIVEVIEEVELPPEAPSSAPRLRGGGPQPPSRTDSRISERVRELKEDAERQERAQRQDSPPRRPAASTRSSKPSEQGSRHNDYTARTGSGRSSTYQETEVDVRYRHEEVRSEAARGPSALSERTSPSQQSRRTQGNGRTTEAAKDAPKDSERVRAFDRRMAAVEDQRTQTTRSRAEGPSDRERNDAEASNTRYLTPPAPARSARSTRSPDREYVHIERRVRPADEPWDGRLPDDRPSEYYIDTEKLYRFSSTASNADPQPQQKTEMPKRKEVVNRDRREQRNDSPSETSTRVRFAKKVEISPTPPGSDASSTQFRVIGARGSKGRAKEGPAESGEDLIAEYERRGRAMARDRRAAPAVEERAKVYEYDRETRHVAGSFEAAGSRQQAMEERPRLDGVDDAAYRPRKSGPLARALSESPSRERLNEMLSEGQSKVSSNSVDGNGPYRPEEPRTGSTEAWNGRERAPWQEGRSEDLLGDDARW